MKIFLTLFVFIYLIINGVSLSFALSHKDNQGAPGSNPGRERGRDDEEEDSTPTASLQPSAKPSASQSGNPDDRFPIFTPSPSKTPFPTPTPTPVQVRTPEPTPTPAPSRTTEVLGVFSPEPPDNNPPSAVTSISEAVEAMQGPGQAADIVYRQIVAPALSLMTLTDADRFYDDRSLPTRTALILTVLGLLLLAIGIAILKLETVSEYAAGFLNRRNWNKKEISYAHKL
jgi:hypothetical protein